MQSSGFSADDLERDLKRALYRFDCPEAQTLGEYELGLVEPELRTRIAAHVIDCDDCRADLNTLRTFLAAPVVVTESRLEHARRLVATLFTPRPGLAFGGLRGSFDASTRIYEAGDVTVTIGPGESAGSMFGLVVLGNEPPEMLQGRRVRLLPRDGTPIISEVDDLGNFEFVAPGAGVYALEIELPDGVVVIEELRVD